jgi:DNA adenine methylase
MIPLIKWSGGKRDELQHILPFIPAYTRYIEPFVGGGAVFFHLAPPSAVISDVHPELIAMYRTIQRGGGKQIHDFMSTHPNTEDVYYQVRDQFVPTTDVEKACKFYYERKTCYRGMLRYNKKGKFNIPFGRYARIQYDDLLNPAYQELLARTVIRCDPFETIFAEYDDPNTFMFLDPPYDSEFTDYGYCSFGKEHHLRLAECFKTTKSKCLMVIGATPFIRELYAGFIVKEFEKKYAFKLHSGRVGTEINNVHLVIANYAVDSSSSTIAMRNSV